MFYSPTTRGFYSAAIHGGTMPEDAIEISEAEYSSLLSGQAAGKQITPGAGGKPKLTDPPVPTAAEQLAAWRQTAVVSRMQARSILHLKGHLPTVEAAIALADPLVQIAWADAQQFERSSAAIAAMAAALGMTDEQVDELFRLAATIKA